MSTSMSKSMSMCMCTCMYMCMCMDMCMCMCTCMCVCVCMCTCMSVCIHIFYICMYLYVPVHVHWHMYTYIYEFLWIHWYVLCQYALSYRCIIYQCIWIRFVIAPSDSNKKYTELCQMFSLTRMRWSLPFLSHRLRFISNAINKSITKSINSHTMSVFLEFHEGLLNRSPNFV